VSIDHVEYLGSERASIAAEKAGIVKAGSTLVLGEPDPDLRRIFLARNAARVVIRGEDFGVARNRVAFGGRVVDLATPAARYEDVFLSLHGAHQADNAVAALTAVECFLDAPVSEDVVGEVMGTVTSPGRLEVVRHEPLVLLDGAHNVAGAHALMVALAEEFPTAGRTFIVGLLREKEPREMLEALGAVAAHRLVCCRAPSARSLDPELIADAAVDLGLDARRVEVVDDVDSALRRVLSAAAADEQVVVTGSLYVVGAARAALRRPSTGGE
jgi:dihydrofolate synthase/folylpolyglutamate synthase